MTFDKSLDEFEAEEARELISDFQTAQESNIAEFEDAKDRIDDLEGDFAEFEDADEELTAEVADATFMSEDEAAGLSFARKREILADFSEEEEEVEDEDEDEDEDGDGDEEAEFSDFGTRGETHNDDEETRAFAEDVLGDVNGLSL